MFRDLNEDWRLNRLEHTTGSTLTCSRIQWSWLISFAKQGKPSADASELIPVSPRHHFRFEHFRIQYWIQCLQQIYSSTAFHIHSCQGSFKTSEVSQQFDSERNCDWTTNETKSLWFLKLFLPVEGCLYVCSVSNNKVYVKEAVHKIFMRVCFFVMLGSVA